MEHRPGPTVRTRVRVVDDGHERSREDTLVTEEPLEIRLAGPGDVPAPLVVTMRTPGADFELAAGFLYSEGIVAAPDDVRTITYCTGPDIGVEQRYNVVSVELASAPPADLGHRYGAISSACGVCGKQSLDDLSLRGISPVGAAPDLASSLVPELPDRLREHQRVFGRTGGLHASGLFSPTGELFCVREDVGRHNALDKVIGWALLERRLPLSESILVVSGRAGFEILQKVAVAGIPMVVAVGAPSSLAVSVANRFGIRLIGFARGNRYVVY